MSSAPRSSAEGANEPVPATAESLQAIAVSPQLLHDLRSPLNQIIGYSDLLVEDAKAQQSEALTLDLERIQTAGRRMLALLEENFTSAGDKMPALVAVDGTSYPARPSAFIEQEVIPGLLLVVDDDETNRDVLSQRLVRQGHTVHTASNGTEALLRMQETPFDVVLLDVMMPEMDGHEVLRNIKSDETLRHTPVIMISALHEVESVVRCIEAGAADYLGKPFDPTLLKARLGACLEKKRGHDREVALYAQLQQNYKLLQEVEKLRDDMRNMIVHDLRTPLTAVIIGVEMLERHGALNKMQHDMMAVAVQGGKTLLGMINDLLDVEKMESGTAVLQYAELSASDLVAGAVSQVASLAEDARTRLSFEVEPGLPAFQGDGSKLTRTLVNLIANAIRFTPAGSVTVLAARADDEQLRISVVDNGYGIPAESFERIFEKFGQLGSHSKVGTGLGLAFCKLAVEAHGGRIVVESTPGSGSTFWFTVPIRRA